MNALIKHVSSDQLTKWERVFCLAYLAFVLLWMVAKPFDSAPDEAARYLLPKYIFLHGTLPDGTMSAVRIPQWGFSYAHYPLFLGPLLSALGMKLASFAAPNTIWVMWGARLPSALAAAGTIVATLKVGKRLLGRPYHWLMAGVMFFLPQFLFLGSYVNNDVLAVFASSLIVLAWVRGMEEGWPVRHCVLLAAGIIVAALSYYNAYGWILCSVPLFFLSWFFSKEKPAGWKKNMWKMAGIIVLIVFICTAFFFVRNAVLYNGDFLGLKTASDSSQQYGADFLKPANRSTPQNLGLTPWQMLWDTKHWGGINWVERSYQSFIGVFGYMSVDCPQMVYRYYAGVFLLGAVGLCCAFREWLKKRKQSRDWIRLCFFLLMVVCVAITVGLSIYYSYAVDYQAQGRYLYPMLIAVSLFTAKGLKWLATQVSSGSVRSGLIGVFVGISFTLSWTAYQLIFLPY